MIFMTLLLLGALVGIATAALRLVPTDRAALAHRGATGAFLAGGIATGLLPAPGPFDPAALTAGAAGAIAFVLLLDRLERPRPTHPRPLQPRPRRPRTPTHPRAIATMTSPPRGGAAR